MREDGHVKPAKYKSGDRKGPHPKFQEERFRKRLANLDLMKRKTTLRGQGQVSFVQEGRSV